MKKLVWAWLVISLIPVWGVAVAEAGRPGTAGDEDPFPWACIDFSGDWRSDERDLLQIEQKKCEWLRVKSVFDSQGATTIVPDDKDREIAGNQWKGTVRHRWNNKNYATAIETHRTLYFMDRVETELVILEKVNDNLLLESTYRTIDLTESPGCPPEREYSQKVYRRNLSGGGGNSSPRQNPGQER